MGYTLPAVRKVRIPTRTAMSRPKSGIATGTIPLMTEVSDVARLVKAVDMAVMMESMLDLLSISLGVEQSHTVTDHGTNHVHEEDETEAKHDPE